MDSERVDMVIDNESKKRKQKELRLPRVSPTLKKKHSLSDIPRRLTDTDSVLDSVAAAFQNQPFIDKVTPSLHIIKQPFITQAINEAVTIAVTKLEENVI